MECLPLPCPLLSNHRPRSTLRRTQFIIAIKYKNIVIELTWLNIDSILMDNSEFTSVAARGHQNHIYLNVYIDSIQTFHCFYTFHDWVDYFHWFRKNQTCSLKCCIMSRCTIDSPYLRYQLHGRIIRLGSSSFRCCVHLGNTIIMDTCSVKHVSKLFISFNIRSDQQALNQQP